MSDYETLPRTGHVRKPTPCFLCTRVMEKGEEQIYWTCFQDGRSNNIHVHPECLKFLEAYCKSTTGCLAQCDGMSEECMWEAVYDRICIPCGKHRRGTGDRFNPLKCGYALKRMKEIGAEQRARDVVSEIARKTLEGMNPSPGTSLVDSVRQALEQPLADIGVSLEKVEQKGDEVVVSFAKDLPRMLDVTVFMWDSKKEDRHE